MRYGKYDNAIHIGFTPAEFSKIQQHGLRDWRWRADFLEPDRILLRRDETSGARFTNYDGRWELRIAKSWCGPGIQQLPRCTAMDVVGESSEQGIDILIDLGEVRAPIPRREKERTPADNGSVFEKFKDAVLTVNRLRREVNAELSVHNGALRADVKIVKTIKII